MAQANINPALSAFVVPVGKLHLDKKNRRKHPDKNLKAVADSLSKLGQQKPIVVDGAGRIIAGNGTFTAATQLLGWDEIAAVTFDGDDGKAKAFALADNRTAELAAWDFEGLSEDVQDGVDMIGWEAHELEPLREADWSPPAVDESAGTTQSTSQDAPSAPQARDQDRGKGGTAGEDPGVPREGALFGVFTESEQSWVLQALALARSQFDEVTSNEQALARLCKEYVDAFQDPPGAV